MVAPAPSVPTPKLALHWDDVNIIHTTDIHGWLLGRRQSSYPEPNYSGDFGDFASFVEHMKSISIEKDADLLIVDSGDLSHNGNGLTNGYPVGGINGHDVSQFIKKLPYDILTAGNHELTDYTVAFDMFKDFAPTWKGHYLTSNANITVPHLGSVPIGSQFVKFKTRKGRKVTSFGIISDKIPDLLHQNSTTVQDVKNMVEEIWFINAINEKPDFFLLVGHIPVIDKNKEWDIVVKTIRKVHKDIPILILGGHSHIRDCCKVDDRSIALQSGYYMDTVGWLSVRLTKGKNLDFTRRYLDPNRVTYKFHTNKDDTNFDTPVGKSIKKGLQELVTKYKLDFKFGNAPHDFTRSRSPYPSDNSLLTLFIEKAAPAALAINNTRKTIPNLIITNTGFLHFDIYKGPFTRNDQFSVSPVPDRFLFIPNVLFSNAKKVLHTLDSKPGVNERRSFEERENEIYIPKYVDNVFSGCLEDMGRINEVERSTAEDLTLGYVTEDKCGTPGSGDDVVHTKLPSFPLPHYINSALPNVADNATIDLVFLDYILPRVLDALNPAQHSKNYTKDDTKPYSPFLTNEILGLYAQGASDWK